MDMGLYAEFLETRLEAAEAEVERIRTELGEVRAGLIERAVMRPERDGRNSPRYMPPSREREEQRAEESAAPLYVVPHEPAPKVEPMATRANDDEKRAFLRERGWSHHPDIENQNINVCWERGAKWYALEDAYGVQLKDDARDRLRSAGWGVEAGLAEDDERWARPGSTDYVLPLHLAIHAIGAQQFAPQIHPDQLVAS